MKKAYEPSDEVNYYLEFYNAMQDSFDEPTNRKALAWICEKCGYGTQHYVQTVTHTDPKTIERGRKELHGEVPTPEQGRQRLKGSGRKAVIDHHSEILDDLHMIIDDHTYGNPMNPLSWTTLSESKISEKFMEEYQISVSPSEVGILLEKEGYSRQNNKKMLQAGKPHPNRDEQFQTINATVKEFLDAGDPVISVDTKKKENLGNFKNNGTEYRPAHDPRLVLDHDFLDKELGKVNPYGVYLLNNNTGFVNLGTDHDTSDFAIESIRRWWNTVGKPTFPNAKRLYINCDGGGSNGSRCRLWKEDLAKLAEETGLEIWVSHFPPGTSKWNKVEHRLFCYITRNWEGKPLYDIETVVELISSTTTKTGLKVKCVVDDHEYPIGKKVSDEEITKINITHFGNETHWNYIIKGFKSE